MGASRPRPSLESALPAAAFGCFSLDGLRVAVYPWGSEGDLASGRKEDLRRWAAGNMLLPGTGGIMGDFVFAPMTLAKPYCSRNAWWRSLPACVLQ